MATIKDFSIQACFAVGWAKFKERPGLWIGVTALAWGGAFFFSYLTEEVYRHIEPTRTILDITSSLVYYWLCFGMLAMMLKFLDGQPVVWTDVFVFDRRVVLYLLATILYGFVVGVGFVFLIIPGVYLALRYGFSWYAIIDGNKGVFDAFHESALITRGVKWQLLLFALATIGIIILGFAALGVGVLIAMPVVMLASTHLYRVLLSQSESEVVVTEPTPSRATDVDMPTDHSSAASVSALQPTVSPSPQNQTSPSAGATSPATPATDQTNVPK